MAKRAKKTATAAPASDLQASVHQLEQQANELPVGEKPPLAPGGKIDAAAAIEEFLLRRVGPVAYARLRAQERTWRTHMREVLGIEHGAFVDTIAGLEDVDRAALHQVVDEAVELLKGAFVEGHRLGSGEAEKDATFRSRKYKSQSAARQLAAKIQAAYAETTGSQGERIEATMQATGAGRSTIYRALKWQPFED